MIYLFYLLWLAPFPDFRTPAMELWGWPDGETMVYRA